MQKMTIRRICILLLALCLLPAAGLGQQEGAKPTRQVFGRQLMDENDFVASFIQLEGQTLIRTRNALYLWVPGTAPRRLAGTPLVSTLFLQQGQPMGLDAQTGTLYRIDLSGDTPAYEQAMRLDWAPFTRGDAPNTYVQQPRFAIAHEGQLFVIQSNWGDLKEDLYSYDLATGERKTYTQTMLQSLVPYRDGLLLGLRYDQNDRDEQTGRAKPPQVVAFDPRQDTVAALPLKLPEQTDNFWPGDLMLYYDAARDAVYTATQTEVLRLREQADPIQTDRLPLVAFWDGGGLSAGPRIQGAGDGRLMLAAGNNLYLRGADEAALRPAVTLTISVPPTDHKAMSMALSEMEDVQAEVLGFIEPDQLNALLMSGEIPADVLALDTRSIDLQKLMQKGYLLDLSDVPTLSAFADDALDAFQKVVRHEGRLYALPDFVGTWFDAAVPERFAAVGREIPRTFPELMELVRWWGEAGHQAHEDYMLFAEPDAKGQLKQMAYQWYTESMQGQGLPLHYDEKVFGAMMQQIDALDVSTWDLPADMALPDAGYADDTRRPLIERMIGYQFETLMYGGLGEGEGQALLLSPDGQMPGWRNASGLLLAAPARTKHPEEVREFLHLYVQHMAPENRAALSRSWNQPVPNPFYEEQMRNTEQALANYQQEIEKSEGAQRREMEANLAHMQARYQHDRESTRYILGPETLRLHQELMSHIYMDDGLTMTQNAALSRDGYLWGMYMDGAISLEQFMQQANDKIRLMVMEGK